MPKEPTTKTTETPPASLNLHQRIRAVMMDVRRLQKDKQVGSGNYAYKAMSEEKVTTVVRNAMMEHGLTLIPVSQVHTMRDYQRPGRNSEATIISLSTVDVTYKLTNVDNPADFELVCSSGTGVDPQDKGVGKAMTYAYKYAMLRAFAIPTGADADDVHNDDLAAEQAVEPPVLRAIEAAKPLTPETRALLMRAAASPYTRPEEAEQIQLDLATYTEPQGVAEVKRLAKVLNDRKAVAAQLEAEPQPA